MTVNFQKHYDDFKKSTTPILKKIVEIKSDADKGKNNKKEKELKELEEKLKDYQIILAKFCSIDYDDVLKSVKTISAELKKYSGEISKKLDAIKKITLTDNISDIQFHEFMKLKSEVTSIVDNLGRFEKSLQIHEKSIDFDFLSKGYDVDRKAPSYVDLKKIDSCCQDLSLQIRDEFNNISNISKELISLNKYEKVIFKARSAASAASKDDRNNFAKNVVEKVDRFNEQFDLYKNSKFKQQQNIAEHLLSKIKKIDAPSKTDIKNQMSNIKDAQDIINDISDDLKKMEVKTLTVEKLIQANKKNFSFFSREHSKTFSKNEIIKKDLEKLLKQLDALKLLDKQARNNFNENTSVFKLRLSTDDIGKNSSDKGW